MPKWVPFAAVAGGILLFAILVVLALTLAQLRDSGGHIEAQDKKVGALFRAGKPLIARADGVGAELRPALEEAGAFVAPLVESSSGADLADVLDRFPMLDSSLRRLVAEAVPVLSQTDPTSLSATLENVARFTDGATALLADLGDRRLLARAERSAVRLRKIVAVQRATRRLQRQSLEIQRQALEVQRRSLEHIRSLDRKTGGEVPLP